MRTSFCHVLVHRDRHVVYDVHTSRLLEVDPILAEVLQLFGPLDRRETVARLTGNHGAAAVHAAVDELESARRREGLFRCERPPVEPPTWTPTDSRAINRRRRQLVLSVTEDCNQRCTYCLHGAGLVQVRPHRQRTMPHSVAKAAVAEFLEASAETPAPTISFYGGEPLLAPGLIQTVVRDVRSSPGGRRVRFSLMTNGLLLDRPPASELVRQDWMTLQVSLDGPATVHDRHRRTSQGEPTHARIESNLTRLLRGDPSLADRLLLIVTLSSPRDLATVGEYFASFPPYRAAGIARQPRLRINRVRRPSCERDDDVKMADPWANWQQALEPFKDRYLAWRSGSCEDPGHPLLQALFDDELIAWHHRSGAELIGPVGQGGCCLPGARRLHVRTDGILQPCERVGQRLLLGTAATGLNRGRIQALRERFTQVAGASCANCWAVRHCRLCYACLAVDDVRKDRLDRACQAVREGLTGTIRLFLDLQSDGSRSLQWLDNTSVE